jgi:hypothetical protein
VVLTLDFKRRPHLIMEMIGALPAILSAVEGLILTYTSSHDGDQTWRLPEDPISWGSFFVPFRSVKILKVQRKLVPDVAYSLFPGREVPVLNLLPALEEIKLRWEFCYHIPDSGRISKSEIQDLQSFVTSRERAGHPVNVFWQELYDSPCNLPDEWNFM